MTPVRQHDLALHAAIDQHGWAVLSNTGPGVPQAMTVGLTRYGQPELVVLGLPDTVAENLLNTLATAAVAGHAHPAGEPISGVLEGGTALMLIDMVDTSAAATTVARALPNPGPVTVRQVVFTDARGLWPWQDGSLLTGMPILGEHPA